MDRTLRLNGQLPIRRGQRVEVTVQPDAVTGEPRVLSVEDLDDGIRYRRSEAPDASAVRWTGRVLECVITIDGAEPATRLTIDPVGPGEAGVEVALHGADAAAEAAKAEADRWGGADRAPEPEPERFW